MAQRILIADDSEEIIEILQILLTGEGYEVVTAGDGEEGGHAGGRHHRLNYSRRDDAG